MRIFILLLFLPIFSQAQVGMWTWVNGYDTLFANARLGTQGVPDSLNTPPSIYEPCEFTDNQGFFWLFGGLANGNNYRGDSNDLWRYDPVTNVWTWMKGSGNYPFQGHYGTKGVSSPLNLPNGRAWGTPSWSDNSGNLWVYGGSAMLDDLWKYNIASNEWTWMKGDSNVTHYIDARYGTYQVADSNNTPGTRFEVAATWTDNSGNLWLFGGGSIEDSTIKSWIYNDLWKYDVSLNQWVWMKGSNVPNNKGYYGVKGVESPLNVPPSRQAYAKWKDPEGNFYLMGGYFIDDQGSCRSQSFNDVWKYRVATNNWIWIGGSSAYNQQGTSPAICETDSNDIPENDWENRAVCFDECGNVFMFGGIGMANCNAYSAVKNELWHYNTYTNEWSVLNTGGVADFGVKGVTASTNKPPTLFGSIAWYKDKSVWMFGGSRSGNSESYNTMWRFDLDTSCLPKFCPLISNVRDVQLDRALKLLPNPAMNELFIETELDVQQINIYDISGSLVHQSKIPQNKAIDITQLAKGIYVVEIKTKEVSVRRKMVKQ